MQINIEKRHFALIFAIIVFLAGVLIVIANPAKPNPGHSLSEIEAPCATGQVLKMTASGWECGDDDTGATGNVMGGGTETSGGSPSCTVYWGNAQCQNNKLVCSQGTKRKISVYNFQDPFFGSTTITDYLCIT